MTKTYTGINIQWPISQLIISGKKSIETRTYNIPAKYLNIDIALIETPGPRGNFKARTIAIIRFTSCIEYKTKEDFYLDMDLHCVTPDSLWAWKDEKPKWGWVLEIKKIITPPVICLNKGIVYRTNIQL